MMVGYGQLWIFHMYRVGDCFKIDQFCAAAHAEVNVTGWLSYGKSFIVECVLSVFLESKGNV